jgi:hypothetical protein
VGADRACPVLGLVYGNTDVHGLFLPFLLVVSLSNFGAAAT